MKNIIHIVLGFFIIVSLLGCLKKDSTPPPLPETTISGFVMLGKTTTAGLLQVYSFEKNAKGKLLTETRLSSDGSFSFKLKRPSEAVFIELRQLQITEWVSRKSVNQPENNNIQLHYYVNAGVNSKLIITPYSLYASSLAAYYINSGLSVQESIGRSRESIRRWILFDPFELERSDITNASNLSSSLSDALRYGFITYAISLQTANVSIALWPDLSMHQEVNTFHYIDTMQYDLQFDGKLNGVGASGYAYLGSKQITNRWYRYDLAKTILLTAPGSENRTGISSSGLNSYAQHISTVQEDFLKGDSPVLNTSEYSIDGLSEYDADVISGTETINWAIISYLEITNTKIIIDGVTVKTWNNKATTWEFDSSSYQDGNHSLKVEITDSSGNTVSSTISVVVNNFGIAFSDITPIEYSVLGGNINVHYAVDAGVGLYVVSSQLQYSVSGSLVSVPCIKDYALPRYNCSFRLTSENNGIIQMALSATNSASTPRTVQRQLSYTVDATSPTVTFNNVTNNQLIRTITDQMTIDVSDTHLNSVTISINDVLTTLTITNNRASFRLSEQTWADGVKTIVVVATDRAGNSTRETRTITIDSTPPEVTVNTFDTRVSGLVQLSGTILDDNLTSLAISIGSINLGYATITQIGGVNQWFFQFNSSEYRSGARRFPDGSYQLKLLALDSIGNQTTLADTSLLITVDTNAPILTATVPAQISCDDQLSGTVVDSVLPTIEIYRDQTKLGDATVVANGTSFNWNYRWQTTMQFQGNRTVNIKAIDSVGNHYTSSYSVLVDCTAPTVVSKQAPTVVNNSLTFTVYVQDTVGEVSSAQLKFGSSELATVVMSANYPYGNSRTVSFSNISLSSFVNGDSIFTIEIVDRAGNRASDSLTVHVDKAPPTLIGQAIWTNINYVTTVTEECGVSRFCDRIEYSYGYSVTATLEDYGGIQDGSCTVLASNSRRYQCNYYYSSYSRPSCAPNFTVTDRFNYSTAIPVICGPERTETNHRYN
ncbi:MAG: Ig-like domain-containing protein [Methylacidiphilales bacterium]|nr:Ig-like domain-containing protein [Candidatus Methylacidiphilales bacterium]